MAAATADVTSMPGVLVPAVAARMLLILIAGVVVAVDDKRELTAETELIASTCFCEGASLRIQIACPRA
jgi:hypothetical protein